MIASRALVVLFALLGPACFSPQGATSETSDPTTTTSTSTSTNSTTTSTSETAPTTSTTTVAPDPTTTSEGTSSATSTSTTTAVSATTEATTADTTTTTTSEETTDPDTTGSSSSTTTTTTGPTGECGDGLVDVGEECDDGNDDDADACTTACKNPKCGDGILHADEECDQLGDNCMSCKRQWMQVFVTSTQWNGDLGGLAGADKRCQDRADSAGLQGRFKAWLSTMASPAASRLQPSLRPYKRIDGVPIADSWADLIDGTPLQNEINVDENGDPGAQATGCDSCRVWTSTLTNGAAYSDTCNNWSFPGIISGRLGECSLKDARWTDGCGTLMCTMSARLYCLEQGLTP